MSQMLIKLANLVLVMILNFFSPCYISKQWRRQGDESGKGNRTGALDSRFLQEVRGHAPPTTFLIVGSLKRFL